MERHSWHSRQDVSLWNSTCGFAVRGRSVFVMLLPTTTTITAAARVLVDWPAVAKAGEERPHY